MAELLELVIEVCKFGPSLNLVVNPLFIHAPTAMVQGFVLALDEFFNVWLKFYLVFSNESLDQTYVSNRLVVVDHTTILIIEFASIVNRRFVKHISGSDCQTFELGQW